MLLIGVKHKDDDDDDDLISAHLTLQETLGFIVERVYSLIKHYRKIEFKRRELKQRNSNRKRYISLNLDRNLNLYNRDNLF